MKVDIPADVKVGHLEENLVVDLVENWADSLVVVDSLVEAVGIQMVDNLHQGVLEGNTLVG